MRDKYGNYVIQRVLTMCSEQQRSLFIDKILKAAQTLKKHKSHARHVFSFLESRFGIKVSFNEEDSSSHKGSKLSSVSKTSGLSDSSKIERVSNPERRGRKSKASPQVKKTSNIAEDFMQTSQAQGGGFTFAPFQGD